jgi:hypothetical protein
MYTRYRVPVGRSSRTFTRWRAAFLAWFVEVSHVNELSLLRVIQPFKVPVVLTEAYPRRGTPAS